MFYNAFLLGSDCFKNIGVPTRTNITTVVDNEISPPPNVPRPFETPSFHGRQRVFTLKLAYPIRLLVHTPNLGFPVVFIPKINSFMTVI